MYLFNEPIQMERIKDIKDAATKDLYYIGYRLLVIKSIKLNGAVYTLGLEDDRTIDITVTDKPIIYRPTKRTKKKASSNNNYLPL
jgi:hypothetical protein